MSYGTGAFGITFWGYSPSPAPPVVREIGDFQFNVRAKSEGYTLRIEYHVPLPGDSPDWSRRLLILRKRGEWPQTWDDTGAITVLDDVFPTIEDDYFFEQEDLESGVIYYYGLFQERIDGSWVHDRVENRKSAYPFDRWGSVDYMYSILPRGYRSEDSSTGHLYQFISILGALIDDSKTDVEHLRTLMEIDNIHESLIFAIDHKIYWPTWQAAGALQRRRDTAQAIDLYKLLGRRVGYEQIIEGISDWQTTVVEGWKYTFFTNDRFSSRTPDMSDPENIRLRGRIEDVLKYTPDTESWHSVSGLGFFIKEIPGVSGALTASMIERIVELVTLFIGTWITWDLIVQPVTEETFGLWLILEETQDNLDEVLSFVIEEFGWETTSWDLFETTSSSSTTNTVTDRIFHEEITYL